jgi:uncharacterized protein YjbI with pentapeptide repeats
LAAIILIAAVWSISWIWQIYVTRFPAIIPLGAGIGGAIVAGAALRQAATARRRHEAQTSADLRRRVTESFSKATEQLGSDNIAVRLGGIYTLESISRESADDHWTVIETLTAFVRERTQRTEAERTTKPLDQRLAERAHTLWEKAGRPEGRSDEFWARAIEENKLGDPPATDIAAVLTVIKRRSEDRRELEGTLDFNQAVLRQAVLHQAHLEGANLIGADLEGAVLLHTNLKRTSLMNAHLEGATLSWSDLDGANLSGAHLEGAFLHGAQLEGALLWSAHLEGAKLTGARLADATLGRAHLEGAYLREAYLFGANLGGAYFHGADLTGAHLERANLLGAYLHGADLREAEGVSQEQIDSAYGDAETQLPEGLCRPVHWPPHGSGRATHGELTMTLDPSVLWLLENI